MKEIVKTLNERAGQYLGEGTNHEGERFVGRLELTPVVGGLGTAISFTATGLDGTLYHEEHTLVSQAIDGTMSMWTLNNNAPGVYQHSLRQGKAVEGAEHSYVFGFGDPSDGSSFREEVTIELWADGAVGYRYAWGLPNGEFKPRSGLKMQRSESLLGAR